MRHGSSNMIDQLFHVALIVCGRLCLGEGAGVHQWDLKMHNSIGVNYVQLLEAIVSDP